MPELPEVETIVRYLRPKIRGRRILDFESYTPRLFRGVSSGAVKKRISGKTIRDIGRCGKYIIFELSGGHNFYVHLMMTGKLLLNPQNTCEKHIRFWMKLSGGNILALHDIRKFGWIRLMRRRPISRGKPNPQTLRLGPDALSLSFQKFQEILKSRQGAIKPLLLNQSILSGIGNIYADEILWYAGIRPMRKAGSFSGKELQALYSAMSQVLRLAIKKGGTSSRDYRKPDGSEGGYYKLRKAYQRAGEKCSRCGGIIKRVIIGQRSAHFCPRHQK